MKDFNFLFYLSILFFILTGCSVHTSKVKEPLMEVPSSFSETQKNIISAPTAGKWWEQFEDEKLNELMERTFQHNLDIAQAFERLKQSQASVIIIDSSRGLILNAEGVGGRARQSTSLGPVTEDTYRLSASASYEIDLWEKLSSRTRAAQFDAIASEENLKALYISISAQLADLYYLAVEQRAQIELSDQTIASFQDTLDRVEHRYRAGLVPPLDVYQSRQNLSAAKAQKPLFESRLYVTLNALSVLTGSFSDKNIGGSARELKDVPEVPVGLTSQLLTRRPDIKSALLRLKANDERIAAAVADRFPSFRLTGGYGGASEELGSILDSPNIFWNLLLQVAQPILDAGRRNAEVDRSEAVFRESLAAYHKTVLEAFREVNDALAKIKSSEERIRMLHDTVSASENSLRLALDRYLQGLTDYLPVLTEQLRYFTSRSNLLAERRQLISERIQLARALGGEWMDDVMEKYVLKDSGIQGTR
jgi:NodT family efflux transporter outer membrane factor (OMF) lipoprotein